MPADWTPVDSSHVSAVRQSRNDLDVRFKDGVMVRYYRAGFLFKAMLRARSKGSFLHWQVKTAGWVRRFRDWDYITE